MTRHLGAADEQYDGQQLKGIAAATADGDATRFDETPAIVQQDAVNDTGRTIYVQFSGDPAPSSPVRGDIRIVES